MQDSRVATRGLVLLGCGKMGSAMLAGWLEAGLPASAVWVVEPNPSDWLVGTGVDLSGTLPEAPAVVLVAVKPQMMAEALPLLKPMGNGDTLFISVAAGITLAAFEEILGAQTPIVRAMPNTPAAISQGITAIVGNNAASAQHLAEAEALLQAVGEVVHVTDEGQIDAVTGVSGSGPAYVFHMIETLAQAGQAQGLDAETAMRLAKATVAGAGALAMTSEETPEQLRINVTSPNGTTQAALEVLMDESTGFPSLMARAVKAAADRSRELANG
ncbi:pyrroline-5-carboxylate reductase [Roseobacter denitrificans]|uniref:Pyrroline-5-carboxylate reductase n=1 Tax=Roseobacter denitrificans (strain ATCC 33942 / OCh 114) TaxID=375451 RepID=Q162W2_ROSDO|nr:pyrroline-5-carboxylate reductase [Roseobacter denitrificans]ABG32981.1 pyrroline-5-carboxylate reductase, putative [Roseobacter denitrificans OCh 114]AVL52363.1 pyrroline-5-carboxylate reductase [Roseobacter denitrificans]SFG10122.1 pyrroline-5-carboxylate reductase [Roseobacter denitrificans OCh 114]